MENSNSKKKLVLTAVLSAVLCAAIILGVFFCVKAIHKRRASAPMQEVAILFTNDVHCGYTDNMGYVTVAAIKDAMEKAGKAVILVDSGDAIQGDVIGSTTEGSAIIDIMNGIGYDVMAVGNHEFDYGIPRLLELRDAADFDMLSCNFTDLEGNTVFDSYKIIEAGGMKIGFIGVSTPLTITSSTPAYFQNEDGEYIYSFSGDEDGSLLAEKINEAAKAARKDGAEYVFVLSHLGIEADASPYTSSEIITKVSGVDAFLDAHSHSIIEPTPVKDLDGTDVILAQTGTKLQHIGLVNISKEGGMKVSLIDNTAESQLINDKKNELSEITEQVIAKTNFGLWIHDPENPEQRLVRLAETNLADLCADSFRDYFDSDIAFVNGGGVRATIPAGDLTFGQIISVMPFGNEICLLEVSGQQVLDALEISVSSYPSENGGFLQVSGLTFDVDVNIDSTVTRDENGMVTDLGSNHRISNVKVGGETLDPEKKYTVALPEYVGLQNGDGMTAFNDATLLTKSGVKDYDLLIKFIQAMPDSTISEAYKSPYGDGRINFLGE